VLSAPFDTIFRVSTTEAGRATSVFEPSILVAMLVYALIGWGIGIFFHGMSTFFFTGRKFKEIKDRMIEEEIKRESP
ncbi:MAG: 2TM domain-containing protein, partial [Desulfobacterales bacterium]|nr:2TM domain-containing protein [Desulfobacterales bacterium]